MSAAFTTVAAAIFLATAFAAMDGSAAVAVPVRHDSYCLMYNKGGSDCGFTSFAQCQATASGIGAECLRNDFRVKNYSFARPRIAQW